MPSLGFFTTIGLILIALDTYVITSWRAFVRRRAWSPWLYRIPYIFMMVMLAVFPLAMMLRRGVPGQTPVTVLLSSLIALWYLPKLPIAMGLLIKDAVRVVLWVVRKGAALVQGRASSATAHTPAAHTPAVVPAAGGSVPVASGARETAVEGRRQFLHTAGWALAGVPFLMVGKGLLHTVHNFRVYRQDIYLPGLHRAFDGMTIAQLSDLHAGSFSSAAPVQEFFRITRELKPDVILITGDWVNSDPRELSVLLPSLEAVRAPLGVYGSLGNHDHYMTNQEHSALVRAIRRTPVELFINENTVLSVDGGRLQLAGTDNSGMNQHFADLDAALRGFSPEHPTILMAHDPTFWDRSVRTETHVDLMLSGHTHGGQFGVHLLGQEMSVADIVYRQWAGLYREGDKQLYVNRGLGTTAFPVRVGIDPEITLFTLRSGTPAA